MVLIRIKLLRKLSKSHFGAKRTILESVRSLHDEIDELPEKFRRIIGATLPDFETVHHDMLAIAIAILTSKLNEVHGGPLENIHKQSICCSLEGV